MDWLFDKIDRRGKSVANSAQKVVADMHHHLDLEKRKVAELEDMVAKFHKLCTTGLEQDIQRLELRKRELVAELQATDDAILDRQMQLKEVREALSTVKSKDSIDSRPPSTPASVKTVGIHSANTPITPVPWPSRLASAPDETIQELERQYSEESDAYDSVKQAYLSLLFLVHRNNAEEVVIYRPIVDFGSTELVSANKLVDFSSLDSIGELSAFEKMMAYGGKVVANHDRDFPSQHMLPLPNFLLDSYLESIKSRNSSPVLSNNENQRTEIVGHLIGAFEIPLTPGVIIDVWMATIPALVASSLETGAADIDDSGNNRSGSRVQARIDEEPRYYWATTPIDGVPFAVLQRMYVVSVTNWGVQSVVQVDLFGRHPNRGHLLLESVTSTAE